MSDFLFLNVDTALLTLNIHTTEKVGLAKRLFLSLRSFCLRITLHCFVIYTLYVEIPPYQRILGLFMYLYTVTL